LGSGWSPWPPTSALPAAASGLALGVDTKER
jgi:hypothetical protein